MPGHDGAYRGIVLNTTDPEAQNRVQVQVPDVPGADSAWARAEETSASLPGVGDEVTIHFENGDENYPIWRPGRAQENQPAGQAGYHATYRGTVLDNIDPGGYRRVAVQVPDVSTETMWAMPEQEGAALPAIGDEVSVRFQDGDVQHPQWSGGSGAGEAAALNGTHAATVVSNLDPEGLGRLYVSVPGVADGVWATPEQAPPGIGESVSVTFEGGSADHPRWTR
jgi:uncharacterized protein involved in type VI secretion and phage assembly